MAFSIDTPGFFDEQPECALLSTRKEPFIQAGLLNICSMLDIKSRLTVSFSLIVAHCEANCTDNEAICVFSLLNKSHIND